MWYLRPVIKENTQRVVVMTCGQCEIEYWLKNSKVRNDGTELQKNLACFQTYGTDVEGGVTLFVGIFWKADRQRGCLNQF